MTLRALLTILLVLAGLGALAGTAQADGDPGSDVLVYQNLFVATDANVSVQQQVQLGNLLSAARSGGFPVRVAIIAQPSDLGAVTALWQKPTAYADFLGTELSLAYTQRLLIVMPNGFGFHWQGHSAAAAYRVLDGLHIGAGGPGLATAAENAVLALAHASGVRLTVPTGAVTGAPADGAAGGPAQQGQSAARPAATSTGTGPPSSGRSSSRLLLIAGVALAAALAVGASAWLLLRGGRRPLRLPKLPARLERAVRERRRGAVPGTWLAGGFVVVAAALIVVHSVVQPSHGGTQDSAAQAGALTSNENLDPGASLSGPAPDFTLTDQFGQAVSLNSFRGKAVILAFNDAVCTTVCPLTTAALVQAKEMLGAAGDQVQLLGVDANPKATSVEDVHSYSELHGMLHQWRYLTGSLAQLQRVWKAYSVGVTISQNQIDHEPATFVIGPDGKLAKLYLTQSAYSAIGQFAQLLANEAASLLPGHPPVFSHLSYAQVSGITPATATSLPSTSGGYVSLGPGQPGQGSRARLYLFFATWDQEVTSLGGQLDALNAYQATANAAGLPELTSVDEGSVEPSPTALPSFLNSLRQPLSYPVAIDDSGRVADGYGVQGEPWFVLASPAGKVIWSWEVATSGWLPAAALQQHVRAALASAATPH